MQAPIPNFGTKFAFALGSSVDSIHNIAFNFFCFFYYTQILQLNPSIAGGVVAIALVVDAISDPAVGMLSDHFRHKLNRRHPFMFAAALPIALFFTGLFNPPAFLADWTLAGWMLIFAIGTRVSLTFFSVPHYALGSEMYPTRHGRSVMMGWHAMFLWAGGASCHFLGLTYFFPGPNEPGSGLLRSDAYGTYGLIWAGVLFLVIFFSSVLTLHRIKWLPPVREKREADPGERRREKVIFFFSDFLSVLKNRNFQWILVGLFFYATSAGVYDVLATHVGTYFWRLQPSEFRYFGVAAFFGYSLGFIYTPILHKWIGKVPVLAMGIGCCSISSGVMIWFKLFGFFPELGTTEALLLVLLGVGLFYHFQSVFFISLLSLIGDISDEHFLNTGERREGVLYSSRTLSSKISSGLGHMVGGIVLSLIAFPLGESIAPADVPTHTITALGLTASILIPLFGLVSVIPFLMCNMTPDRHDEIMQQIQDQQANATPEPAT